VFIFILISPFIDRSIPLGLFRHFDGVPPWLPRCFTWNRTISNSPCDLWVSREIRVDKKFSRLHVDRKQISIQNKRNPQVSYITSGHYFSSCLLFKTQDGKSSYFTGNTLRFHCESNRLMRSIALWRWYINMNITLLVIIHRLVFYLKHKIDNFLTSKENNKRVNRRKE
jgi:hypothetical protein